MSNQALVKKILTVAVTFVEKPDVEVIKKLKADGAEYRNGQWVRSHQRSELVSIADASTAFAAA